MRSVRRLVLPTALAVTSIGVAVNCSDGSGSAPTTTAELRCSDVPAGPCQKCTGEDGGIDCAGHTGCFYAEAIDVCDDALA